MANGKPNGKLEQSVKWLQLSLTVVLTVLGSVLMVQWTALNASVSELEKFAAATQSNRFTASDGQEVWKAIGDVKASVPRDVPPVWFKTQVDALVVKIDVLLLTVRENQLSIQRLEEEVKMLQARE